MLPGSQNFDQGAKRAKELSQQRAESVKEQAWQWCRIIADGASSVAEAMADPVAELKHHSSNGADLEAAPKETSYIMTEVWKRLAENASNC